MQKDFVCHLRSQGVSQEALEAARIMGDCCSVKIVEQDAATTEHTQVKELESFIGKAIENKSLIVAVIDDYTAASLN